MLAGLGVFVLAFLTDYAAVQWSLATKRGSWRQAAKQSAAIASFSLLY